MSCPCNPVCSGDLTLTLGVTDKGCTCPAGGGVFTLSSIGGCTWQGDLFTDSCGTDWFASLTLQQDASCKYYWALQIPATGGTGTGAGYSSVASPTLHPTLPATLALVNGSADPDCTWPATCTISGATVTEDCGGGGGSRQPNFRFACQPKCQCCPTCPCPPAWLCIKSQSAEPCADWDTTLIELTCYDCGKFYAGQVSHSGSTLKAEVALVPDHGYRITWTCDDWDTSGSAMVSDFDQGPTPNIVNTATCPCGYLVTVGLYSSQYTAVCPPREPGFCQPCNSAEIPTVLFVTLKNASICHVDLDGTYALPLITNSPASFCKWQVQWFPLDYCVTGSGCVGNCPDPGPGCNLYDPMPSLNVVLTVEAISGCDFGWKYTLSVGSSCSSQATTLGFQHCTGNTSAPDCNDFPDYTTGNGVEMTVAI